MYTLAIEAAKPRKNAFITKNKRFANLWMAPFLVSMAKLSDFRVKKKFFARLKEDGETPVLKVGDLEKDFRPNRKIRAT